MLRVVRTSKTFSLTALAGLLLTGCGGSSSNNATTNGPTPTTTAMNATPSSVAAGASVTLSASVGSAGSATPTGTVTFSDGSSPLGTVSLNSSGIATMTTSFTSTGTHNLSATYSGSTYFSASTSGTVAVTVSASTASGLASGGASSIYVVQQAAGGGSILQFSVGATGSATPIATLTAPAGDTIESVATDSSGQIYVGVLNSGSVGEVLVYPSGASGAATPTRTIVGVTVSTQNSTTFTQPMSMVVGANNVLYILSTASGYYYGNPYAVTAFSSTANGSATPLYYITGSQTQMLGPLSIAADAGGNIYVSTITAANGGAILVFAAGATGNVAPVRVITSPNPFYGVAVDGAANIYSVEDSLTGTVAGSIVEFTAGASGAATPMRTITGAATGFFFGGGIRVDSALNLYVVNAVAPTTSTAQTVVAFPPSAVGNVAPAVNFSSASWSEGGSEIAIR